MDYIRVTKRRMHRRWSQRMLCFVTDSNIAYCGLDCEACEARLATVNNDNELRIKVSKEYIRATIDFS